MTDALVNRTRLLAATLTLAAAVGCTTSGPTNDLPHGKVDQTPARPEAPPEMPPPAHQTVENTNHWKAQKIFLKALDIFEQHEYDLAYLEFGRALDIDPNYYQAWFKKGLCAYYKQRYDLEIDCYRRCLEIQPDFMEALINLANAYLAQDQLERAVPIYRRILAIDPNHPVALYNLGICYFDLQDYHASIEHLHRFIEAHPQDPSRPKAEDLLRRARQKLDALDAQR